MKYVVTHTKLALVGGNIRNDAVLLSKTVKRIISFTLLANKSAENVGESLIRNNMTLGIELSDINLGGSVILGLHKTACGGALTGNKKFDVLTRVVLHFYIFFQRIVISEPTLKDQ